MVKCVILIFIAVSLVCCKTNAQNRIINGTPAVVMQFPWHASLRITVSNSIHQSFCGATIISETYCLTAASCLRNVVSIQVDLGSVSFSSPLVTLHSNQMLLHPNFNDNFNTNDIAIIRLPHPIAFSANIRPINLPAMSQASETFENAEVHIPGFGVTEPGGNTMSEQLFFAHKQIISNNQCLQHFNTQFIQPSTVCAIGVNNSLQTSCFGDRGGALVGFVDGAWVMIGITSLFHHTGCTGLSPVGYSRITSHLQWISSNTGIPIAP